MRHRVTADTRMPDMTLQVERPFNPAFLHQSPRFKDSQEGFMELSYEELKEKNLDIREKVEKGEEVSQDIKEELRERSDIKAITIYFSDAEGKLHFLDYDKDHILSSEDNLTFDGSSIKGFSELNHSDLRMSIDWSSFRWPPADVFGAGKVLVFADIKNENGNPYKGDARSNLKHELEKLKDEHGAVMNVAPEIEGFLLDGIEAEKHFDARTGMHPASEGGYFSALPQDRLRVFIDQLAEATRAMGFKNEKDHPEVAPGQFELTYQHRSALHAADQILLYKLTARQIAANMGCTASFMPKPIAGINGSGMHSNISLQNAENRKNLFYDTEGPDQLSKQARMFIAGVLNRGEEMCLTLNSSVNSYRRLDPNFEAPNEVKMHGSDRGSMVRVPIGNEKSARMEVRTVAPDANPYLAYTLILRAGLEGMLAEGQEKAKFEKLLNDDREIAKLPGTIQDSIALFEDSEFIERVMGPENKAKYLELKKAAADRSPKALGTKVKKWEILDHHEVRNQQLSADF